jgi:hypothetical protein
MTVKLSCLFRVLSFILPELPELMPSSNLPTYMDSGEGCLAQRKSKISEIALKVTSAREEFKQGARYHDSLTEKYMNQHIHWQMDRNRVYDQVNHAEDSGSPKCLIEALEA